MQELAPPELDASVRLTQQEAQELVLRTVATHAEALLRTAYRHSLCADDAHDAYQRGMEIFMRRAPTLDAQYVSRWLHVVVKREAMEVRRGRSELVATEDIDFDHHEAPDVSSPEERVLSVDRATRAAEALRRLKPQELRAMWLKALGHSYADQRGHADPAGAATLTLSYQPPPAALEPAPASPIDPGTPPGGDPGGLKPRPPLSPAKIAADLRLSSTRRIGRRVTVSGRLTPRATGRVTIRYRARIGSRTRTTERRATLRKGRFSLSFTLSKALAHPRAGTIVVTYGGNARTRSATRRATLRLAR